MCQHGSQQVTSFVTRTGLSVAHCMISPGEIHGAEYHDLAA